MTSGPAWSGKRGARAVLLAEAGQAEARARGVRALGCCAGRGEKSGPRWAVREGKKGETAWAVRGLGLGRFGLRGWFSRLGLVSSFGFSFYFSLSNSNSNSS